MKSILLVLTIALVNPCFAVRYTRKKNRNKNKLVEKASHKQLVKNHQTGAISLVDVIGSYPDDLHLAGKIGRPDWQRLIAHANQTIDSRDPEIELTQLIDAHNKSSSVDWNAVAAYVCQPGRIAQILDK